MKRNGNSEESFISPIIPKDRDFESCGLLSIVEQAQKVYYDIYPSLKKMIVKEYHKKYKMKKIPLVLVGLSSGCNINFELYRFILLSEYSKYFYLKIFCINGCIFGCAPLYKIMSDKTEETALLRVMLTNFRGSLDMGAEQCIERLAKVNNLLSPINCCLVGSSTIEKITIPAINFNYKGLIFKFQFPSLCENEGDGLFSKEDQLGFNYDKVFAFERHLIMGNFNYQSIFKDSAYAIEVFEIYTKFVGL